MDNKFVSLSKKIENYEQNRIRILKKTIIIASPAILLFLSFGIYLFYFGIYIFGGGLISIMILMIYKYIREIFDFKQRKEINKLLTSEISKVDIINHILKKNSQIAPTLEKSIKQRKSLQISKDYHKNLLQYLLIILTDLRSDLSIRLTEQQQSLEGAKSEVEKNIGGTTDLEKVSKLQKVRLDKQIEQFEELQRILIKV